MGLFDIFKRKRRVSKSKELESKDKNRQTKSTTSKVLEKETASIPDAEKKYYQEDEYYTAKAFEGAR